MDLAERRERILSILGRRAWAKLHGYRPDVWDPDAAIEWFNNWCKYDVPSYCLTCREEWAKVMEEFPPVFDCQESFFRWTVRSHNAVNRKLGKPIMKLSAAVTIYQH